MPVTIYHNPRCSKSRQTLELLESKDITANVVNYLETPPSTNELKHILKLLGFTDPRTLMRTKESEYKDNGLDNATLPEDALIAAMHTHPKLIERPIVIANNKAAIGRPPENVLKIL